MTHPAHRLAAFGLIFAVLVVPALGADFEWRSATPESQRMDSRRLESMRAELARRDTKALLVMRHDHLVLEWYAEDHGAGNKHYTASLAKALVGGLSIALALDDDRIALDERASKRIPAWRSDARKSKITIRQLATHSSGIEDAADPDSGKSHNDLPGWKGEFWRGRSIEPTVENVRAMRDPFSISIHRATLAFEPGTDYAYSNPGMALLAYAVTAALRGSEHEDARTLLRERVMRPIGVPDGAWSVGYGRTYPVDGLPVVPNWGGGSFTARALARVGRLVLRRGDWEGRRIISESSIDAMTSYAGTSLPARPLENPRPAPALGWYSNADGVWPRVPRDAVAGAGAGNQVLLVVPSLDLVVVRNGSTIGRESRGEGFWRGLETHLFEPVTAAVADPPTTRGRHDSPYPPSAIIRRIDWGPKRGVRRAASGSDNWPLTWGDDDAQYTAYGDGWGFEPRVERKLSMGFAKITGGPDGFRGENVRSPTGETTGQGARGKKASGILMVGGVLYLWARNADNSQLAWSGDHGATWDWSDWTFQESFGAPTFLNFGKNYAGARDEFVYTYSFDSDSAYVAADHMVLARVHESKIRSRAAWEFFAGLGSNGDPRWSRELSDRAAVFENPGECYRSGITYDAGIKRYLWVQILPGAKDTRQLGGNAGPRFTGGFGVFDAPEPWGPWTTVYFTRRWDIGPGETASFPTKWMSADGRTVHLVGSSDDHFTVRRGELVIEGE